MKSAPLFSAYFVLLSLVIGIQNLAAEEIQPAESDGNADEEYEDYEEEEADSDAEADAGEQQRMEEIIVSDERRGHVGITVQKIERSDIEEASAPSVAELLNRQPSIQAGFGSRGEMIFKLRGFDQRQLLVLVDGVPLSIPYDGQADLFKIPAEAIDKVEIIKGSGSIAYGPNGLGGAVNLVTRKPGEGPLVSYSSSFTDVRRMEHALAHSGKAGKLAWFATAGFADDQGFRLSSNFKDARNEDGGVRNNADKTDWHAILKSSFEVNPDHSLQAGFTMFQSEGGVAPHTEEPDPRYWRWKLWRDMGFQVGHRGRYFTDLVIDELAFVNLYRNTIGSYDDDNYDTQETDRAYNSTYNDLSAGGRIRSSLALHPQLIKRLDLRLWLGTRYDRHAETWDVDRDKKPAIGVVISTVSPEMQLDFNRIWTLLLGGQFDFESPVDFPEGSSRNSSWFIGPMADLRITPVEEISIELSAAGRGRFPTLRERFSSAFGSLEPNPDLGPEKSWNFGLDFTARPHESVLIRVGGFESEVYDLLVQNLIDVGVSQWQNASRARLYGAEADIAWESSFGLRLEGGYAFLKGERLDADPPENRLEYRPDHSAYFSADYQPIHWFKFGSNLRMVGRQDYLNGVSGQWGRLGYYFVWDARADFYPSGMFHPWIRISNILDMNYQSRYGFPEAGREYWFGFRLQYPELGEET